MDEGQEEGPERTAGRVVGPGSAPQRQKGLVDDVLGERCLPGHAQGESVRRGGVPPIQGLEGPGVEHDQAPVQIEVLDLGPLGVLGVLGLLGLLGLHRPLSTGAAGHIGLDQGRGHRLGHRVGRRVPGQ